MLIKSDTIELAVFATASLFQAWLSGIPGRGDIKSWLWLTESNE